MVRYFRLMVACFVLGLPGSGGPALAQDADPGEGIYFSANALYNRGLYKLAVDEYEAFLKNFPQHAKASQARLGLALSHYGAGDHAKAEPLLAAAGQAAKGDTAVQLMLMRGQCLLALDRAAEAEKVYSPAVASARMANRAAAWVGLAEACYRQEKWAAVVEAGNSLLKDAPGDVNAPRVRFQVGLAHYRLKQFADAGKVLAPLEGAAAFPALVHQARYVQAECHRELDELDQAAALYDKVAADKDGAFALESRFRLGFVRLRQDKFKEAAADLQAYLKAAPNGPLVLQAQRALGRAYVQLKDYRNAESVLNPLATSAKPDAEAALWLARAYTREKRHADAAGVLQRPLQAGTQADHGPALLFDLGQAQLALAKYAEAAGSFARVVKEFDSWAQAADAMRLQAVAEHRAGNYEAGLGTCNAFLAKYAGDAGAGEMAFVKAENLLLLKRDAEALAAYRAYLDKYAGDARVAAAGFRTAQILHRLERWDEALARALPFAGNPPQDPLFDSLWFLVGDCYFRKEAWPKAEEYLKRFVAKPAGTPSRDVALLELGLVTSRLGNPAGAQAPLSQLIAGYPQSPQRPLALVELGRLQYEARQYDPARQSFQAVAGCKDVTPDSVAQAMYYLGWIEADQGRHKEAAVHFQALAEKHPGHALAPDALLQLGRVQLKQDAHAPAAATLDKLVKTFPQFGKLDHALFYLGVAHARQEQWAQAAPRFETVIAKHPDSVLLDRALYEAAWCRKRLKDPAAAMKRYASLLAHEPRSELADRATFELAELEFEAERYDEAIRRLNGLLPTLKDAELKEQVLYRLGWCQVSKDDPAAAATAFENLLRAFPKTPFFVQAAFQAGEARMARDEHEAARAHFEAACSRRDVKEVHEPALLRLGETRALTAQWPQAEAAYREFTQLYGQSKWVRRASLGLGWARENQGRHAEAIQAYTQGLAGADRDETAARCQFQIGECLFAMKQLDEAVRALVKVSVNYGYPKWSARALLETGRALEQMGQAERALAQYEEVVREYAATDAATVAKERVVALKSKK